MPKPLSFTPPWLSRPSDGFDFFQPTPSKSTNNVHSTPIAHRGTELFAAVGNELRWTDLVMLKEEWETQDAGHRRSTGYQADHNTDRYLYRTLKAPVTREIKRIVMSPTGALLAIVTSHTVHIAILPESTHLTISSDNTPIRLKCFQLGPTDHVLERSQIATALWHPLGVNGSCLVTITVDAIARLWELDVDNRWSFDKPALAIDLKKLANGTGTGGDYSPSKYATSRGFSPDDFELEVASACFGGAAQEAEVGWSSLTLWVAMKGGDIYALCPFIPSKWVPPPSLVTSLINQISIKSAAEESSIQTLSKQITWASDIDEQLTSGAAEHGIFKRPSHTSSVPMMQGPLRIQPDMDDVFDISDVFVIAGKEQGDDVEHMTFEEDEDRNSMEVGIVLIGTSDGRVCVCLDVDGIEARWPAKGARLFSPQKQESSPELLLIETLEASRSSTDAGIFFTKDVASRNAVFVSHEHGVSHLDLSSWSRKLREELAGFDSGTDFRLDLLVENARTHIQHILRIADPQPRTAAPSTLMANGEDLPVSPTKQSAPVNISSAPQSPHHVPIAINIFDADLGHFLLTVTNRTAHSAVLDDPSSYSLSASDASDYSRNDNLLAPAPIDPDNKHAIASDLREAYQPPSIFWEDSKLQSLPSQPNLERIQRLMHQQVQLSPMTLNFLIEAHRLLSAETSALGEGAADLFRRCERLRDELKEQIRRDADVAGRIDSVLNEDADDYRDQDTADGHAYGVNAAVERRIEAAQARQLVLDERYAELKRKAGTLAGRPLSDKETEWQRQVGSLAHSVLGRTPSDPSTPVDETLPQMRPDSAAETDDAGGIAASLARVKLEGGDDGGEAAGARAVHARLAELSAVAADVVARAREQAAAAAAASNETAAAATSNDRDVYVDSPFDGSRLGESTSSSPFRTRPAGVDQTRRGRESYAQIRELLERETALVEAAARKAGRLGAWVPAAATSGHGGGPNDSSKKDRERARQLPLQQTPTRR